jgi:hypothetical protein
MVLTHPDFTFTRPATLAKEITDAEWWLWLRLRELEPTSQLGGILAWKSGFHSTGDYNQKKHPGNYSVRDAPNRTGPWWLWYASALDWTFPEAHGGDYGRISRYTRRLLASARDPGDPRLDLILYEFFGQADNDRVVEGFNEYREQDATSDPSHLFHLHFSFLRKACGDFWAMWALLTVLMGWSVAQWRASLPGATPPVETYAKPGGELMYMIQVAGNDSVYVSTSQSYRGIDYPTFRFYVDQLKLPFTMVPDQAALLARGGVPLADLVDQPATFSEAQMERVKLWITEAVGEAGVAEGTIPADALRKLLDDEAISLDELASLARQEAQAQLAAAESANGSKE